MILAIDCDLRQSYGVTDTGLSARGNDPWQVIHNLSRPGLDTVLFEIASPVSFNRGGQSSAIMHNLAKWALWNMGWAGMISEVIAEHETWQFLVAPSNIWTKGYDLKTRHLIAKCKQPKKDLRDCEAMIFMYQQEPKSWVPLDHYLTRL